MPKISVIVPVYNAASLIPRCIDSVLSQTFHDLELIIVDDGSCDSSLEVSKEYARKDKRIQVYHKENGGQTSARKYGFFQSKGEYIYFVDADDFLPKDALQLLIDKAIKNKLDMVDGASISYYEDFTIKENVKFSYEGEFSVIEYLDLMFQYQANMGTHACLIKRELFQNDVFNISEEVKLGEDAFIHLCLVLHGNRIGIYNDYVYYYVQNKDSITHNYSYLSLRPIEIQIESIRSILVKNNLLDRYKLVFYRRAIESLATACLHNKQLIYDGYNKKMAKEALPIIQTLRDRGLCCFLKYPVLYPIFYMINEIRKGINNG